MSNHKFSWVQDRKVVVLSATAGGQCAPCRRAPSSKVTQVPLPSAGTVAVRLDLISALSLDSQLSQSLLYEFMFSQGKWFEVPI